MDNYRYEIKFNPDRIAYYKLINYIDSSSDFMKSYLDRKVNSVYFDDSSFTSIRDNLGGFADRIKYRLRWYDKYDPSDDQCILNFEKKIRNGRLGSKKHFPIIIPDMDIYECTPNDLYNFISYQISKSGIILNNKLFASLMVSYLRSYYVSFSGIRLTIDRDINYFGITAQEKPLSSFYKRHQNTNVIELKFNPEQRLEAINIIEKFSLVPVRHSKYTKGMSFFTSLSYL